MPPIFLITLFNNYRQISYLNFSSSYTLDLFAAFDQALEFHKSKTIPANWKTELKEDSSSSEAEEEEEEEDDEKEKEDNSSEEEVRLVDTFKSMCVRI